MSNSTLLIRYTTAPADYDSFGITGKAIGEYNGKPLRCVEVPSEHETWYSQRCASGLYPVFDVHELHRLILHGQVCDATSTEPDTTTAAVVPESADLPRVAYECTKHHHAKKNFDYWLLHLPKSADKLDSADFSRIRSEVESRGGWYSRKFGRIPGGFAFKNEADAKRMQADLAPNGKPSSAEPTDFVNPTPHNPENTAVAAYPVIRPVTSPGKAYRNADDLVHTAERYYVAVSEDRYLCIDGVVRNCCYHNGQPVGWFLNGAIAATVLGNWQRSQADTTPETADTTSTLTGDAIRAAKLRTLLDRVVRDVDTLRNSIDHALTNTHKRRGEQAERRNKLFHLERVATALDKLQDLHDRRGITPDLDAFHTKKSIGEALQTGRKHDGNGLYVDDFEYLKSDNASKALQALIGNDNDDAKADLERAELDSWLATCQVDGFYPTPEDVAESLVVAARIDGHMNVLEPSAGHGAIADVINQRHRFASVHCVEINNKLAEICKRRTDGRYTHRADFLEWDIKPIGAELGYQRVVMNPPFERNQWREHVMHALDLLVDGGRLVALLPNTAQTCKAFHDLLIARHVAYEFTDMGQPFKNGLRPTSVRCVMLVIDIGKSNADKPTADVMVDVEPSTELVAVDTPSTELDTTQATDVATETTDVNDDKPTTEAERRRALFTIDRASFSKALTRLSDTAPSGKSAVKTVLQSVRVSVNGSTTLSAFDLERWHDETLQSDHDGEFDILVDAKRLKQVVSKSRVDTLHVELWDRSLRVAGATLPSTADVDDFPSADGLASNENCETVATWRGSASELASMFERTVFATDAESSRYALGGCKVEFARGNDDMLTVVGTDGRRLAVSRCGGSIEADDVESCIIASAHIKGACKALKSADDATLSITRDRDAMEFNVESTAVGSEYRETSTNCFTQRADKVVPQFGTGEVCNVSYDKTTKPMKAVVSMRAPVARLTTSSACGTSSFIFRQLDGRYPKWRDVLPKVETLAEVDAKALYSFATAVQSATYDEARSFDLTIDGNALSASVKNDVGEFSDTLTVRGTDAERFECCLDARFVLDFAKSVQRCGESIRIGGTDAEGPIVMQADNVACVIMPLARDKARK